MTVEVDLLVAANSAAAGMERVSVEIEEILMGLPRSASQRLREQLLDLAARLDEAATALRRELDRPAPDHETVGILTKWAKRAAMFAGATLLALASGASEGVGSEIFRSLAQSEHLTAVEFSAKQVEKCLVTLAPAQGGKQAEPLIPVNPKSDVQVRSVEVAVSHPNPGQVPSPTESRNDNETSTANNGEDFLAPSHRKALDKEIDYQEKLDSRGLGRR